MTCNGDCSCNKSANGTALNTEDSGSGSDVWASETEEEFKGDTYGKVDSSDSTEVKNLRRKFGKLGYIEGKSNSQETAIQKSFDKGYGIGTKLGLEAGEILATMYLKSQKQEQTKEKFNTLVKELRIEKVLDVKYFDQAMELQNGKHPVLESWQEDLRS